MEWKARLNKAIELPGKFLANGGHAQQAIPAQHRLLNAGGMGLGWLGGDQLRHIAFGVRMKSEGEYEEVNREDIPAPLRFLHKSIEWDPHSETAENQWKKLVYQLMPGVGAAVGALAGSIFAFNLNGREQKFKELKGMEKLKLLDADYAAQFAQSTPLRLAAGFFATFSSVSGLTYLYGLFLNNAFASSNGAKIFTGSLAKGNMGPEKALASQLENVGAYVHEALETGKVSDAWAKQFVTRVLEPMFGHELSTPEAQKKAVASLQGIVESSFKQFQANGSPADKIVEAVSKDLTSKLGKAHIDETLKQIGLDPAHAKVGNANPLVWQMQNVLHTLGIGHDYSLGPSKTAKPIVGRWGLAGATAALAGGAAMLSVSPAHASTTKLSQGSALSSSASLAELASQRHAHPSLAGKTAREYAYEAYALHDKQHQGTAPGEMLKWMGDAQLAVFPKNRICCAIGLTTGLMVAGSLAKIATGYGLDKKPVDIAKVPTFLQGMKGIVKNYNPQNMLNPRNRWIHYAQWAAYSFGGFMGIKMGTDIAYGGVKKKNVDPHYIEDYLPRVSMHQGDNWSLLSAFSGIFGSAAGLFTIPIPGINYALSLVGRTSSMQDRNIMLPGLNQIMTGSDTTSFLRLREGASYLCHYEAENPAETPAQTEYLAYAMLAPIFKEQLTASHIQQFTDAVYKVRDPFLENGQVPKAKRGELLKAMQEVFTGAGLEVLLINMGLNPGTIRFDALNGLTGTIGNVGISTKIHTEQDNYHKALIERLPTYVEQGVITQARADWVKEGINAVKKQQPLPEMKMEKPEPQPAAPETTPEPYTPQPAEDHRFADRAPHKHAADALLRKSEAAGDWREAARLSKEKPAPIAVA